MNQDHKSTVDSTASEPDALETDAANAQGAPEAATEVPAAVDSPPYEDLQAEIEQLKDQNTQLEETVMRVKAEMENLRKRSTKELENAYKYGVERLVMELLPVRDSMELGLSASDDGSVDPQNVREGIELTLKMLDRAAEKFGLTPVEPAGEAFNPKFHQAMAMQESSEVESGKVISVVQKGYLLHDRVVRPAMVIVAK